MGAPYDFAAVEARWQARWDADRLYQVDVDRVGAGEKLYNLVEFPYPSAEGLHAGHVFKYCGADAWGRYWRMRGKRVFQPIGFDSFGIHSENFALKVGEHPASLTARVIPRFRRQLSSVGIGWDWSRQVTTSDPSYYRWTQWVFLQLFRAGLAYRAAAPVLWCPSCLTVLAREQVEGEVCERCDSPVAERTMEQWFLRTTAYARRLLDGLDVLDWPARAKTLQRNWIGADEAGEGGFRLHDWLISRQRYWGTPIPVVHCPSCGPVGVPDRDLPVVLPPVEDFRPLGTGVSPLAAVESWVNVPCPSCGAPARRETDVADNFLDSSWYFLRYPSTDVEDRPWDADRLARLLPVDHYAGGPEHVMRHHLYARFVTMALNDLGLVGFDEPFPRMRLGGVIVQSGAKMSKSRGNVVSPDTYVAEVGGDALRLGLLFTGPWEHGGEFTDAAIPGVERFLSRVWRVMESASPSGDAVSSDRVIERVSTEIDAMRFNTATAALMELASSLRARPSLDGARTLVLLLAPLAPYVAEELWARLGGSYSVHTQPWPSASSSPVRVATHVDLVVQVDGRSRGRIRVPVGTTEEEARAIAESDPAVARWLTDRYVTRTVHVPDRLLNLVTDQSVEPFSAP